MAQSTRDPTENVRCAACGMVCYPGEFHPYAACLIYRECRNRSVVRENLRALIEHARFTQSDETFEQWWAAQPEPWNDAKTLALLAWNAAKRNASGKPPPLLMEVIVNSQETSP